MEKFIIAAGCALRISDCRKNACEPCGCGEQTIILLHGYLESLDVWDEFIPLLTPGARVISLDLPGHGVSQVMGEVHSMEFLGDVVAGVMDKLGVEKATIVGHSMGGYVALALLKKHPQRVERLVMFHSTPNPDSEQRREMRVREIGVITSGKRDLLAATAPIVGFAEQNRKRLSNDITALSERILMFDEDGIVAVLRGLAAREDMNEILRNSNVPQLFIFGRGDEYITPEIAQTVITNQPQAQVVWLENSGHMGFIEEPAEAAVAILRFIGVPESKK